MIICHSVIYLKKITNSHACVWAAIWLIENLNGCNFFIFQGNKLRFRMNYWPSGYGGDFKISSIYFHSFVIISTWKKAWSFIWKNLNPLHPRMLCTKFGWNWSSGSGEEKENGKSLRQRGRTTDKLWSEKLTWAFDSGELKTYTHYLGWNPFNQKGTDDITWGPSILKYLLIRR